MHCLTCSCEKTIKCVQASGETLDNKILTKIYCINRYFMYHESSKGYDNNAVPCANPESFVRGGSKFDNIFFMRGLEDPNATINGHHRPASETPFKWCLVGQPMMVQHPGLTLLRICCSQHFSQMEKVAVK